MTTKKYFCITLPTASDFPSGTHEPSLVGRARNCEHESTCESIGRNGVGNNFNTEGGQL